MLQILENFYTLQGEGRRIGVPSLFLRLGGCFLTCVYCDSKFTWPTKHKNCIELKTSADITQFFENNIKIYPNITDIVFTGGEPLWKKDNSHELLRFFVQTLSQNNFSISFETTMLFEKENIYTNGGCFKNLKYLLEFFGVNDITFCISPKLDHLSYGKDVDIIDITDFYYLYNLSVEEIQLFRKHAYYKFVHEENNEQHLVNIIQNYPKELRQRMCVMPVTPFPYSKDTYEQQKYKTVDFCKKHQIRFSPRLHVDLWGLIRGV